MPSSKKKGQRRFNKANSETTSTALSTANPSAGADARAQRIHAAIRVKYKSRWEGMITNINQLQRGDPRVVDWSRAVDWSRVENKCSELFADISRLHRKEWKSRTGQDQPSMDMLSVFRGAERIFCLRGIARFFLKDYEGAISDLTNALARHQEMVLKEWSQESWVLNAAILFHYRGLSHKHIGNMDKAVVDMRAACATYHDQRLRGTDFDYSDEKCRIQTVSRTLEIMALQKAGAPRPHYDKGEIKKIENELRINRYDPANLKCQKCGKNDQPDCLQSCAKCRIPPWYCSRECQSQDWSDHKVYCCSETNVPIFLPDCSRAQMELAMEQVGGTITCRYRDCMFAILNDPSNDRCFVSLWDAEVFFLPSELDLVPDKYKDLAKDRAHGMMDLNGGFDA